MKCVILGIIAYSLLLVGCYDRNSDGNISPLTEQANIKIGTITDMASATTAHTITSDMVCVGRISTSDKEGNFYRSIFIEDETGGLEVLLGIYDIVSQYPVGLEVALRLRDCAIMKVGGVTQVGLPPRSFDSSPRDFEAQVIIDKHLTRGISIAPIEPLECNISSLSTSLCGRLIRIENLQYIAEATNDTEPTMVGYTRFEDSEGCAIYCNISKYADFADTTPPTELVSIQGILFHEDIGSNRGLQFVIKPSLKDDIQMSDSSH